MGRGSSKGGKGGKAAGAAAPKQANEPEKTLYNKSQVDDLTKDYTPQMFLGDIENTWTGTLNDLRSSAEEHAPDTLNIGGYTFEKLGNPFVDWQETKGNKNGRSVIMLDYQANEMVGNEYPVLQVGIAATRTRGGKIKANIIRDGYTNRTRFW